MQRLQQLLKQIGELTPEEREQLMVELFDSFQSHQSFSRKSIGCGGDYHPSIVQTPGVCGGAARLVRTRIPVWTIERMRQLGVSEVDILRSFPTLRAVDLVEASSYAARHREEIEKAIRENEEDGADGDGDGLEPGVLHGPVEQGAVVVAGEGGLVAKDDVPLLG